MPLSRPIVVFGAKETTTPAAVLMCEGACGKRPQWHFLHGKENTRIHDGVVVTFLYACAVCNFPRVWGNEVPG